MGLREGTGEIICLKVFLQRRQTTSYYEFRERVYSILKVLHSSITETSAANDGGNCWL